MTMMTREMVAMAIAERDRARGAASRTAEMIMGGCDRDEMTQRLADAYAEWLGISEADEEYDLVCEIADEHVADELSDDEE